MDQGFRRGFTASEKTELWDRWQRGESLKAIGRAFGKPSSSIYFQVSPSGIGVTDSQVLQGCSVVIAAKREKSVRHGGFIL
jgi:hypothetical protein